MDSKGDLLRGPSFVASYLNASASPDTSLDSSSLVESVVNTDGVVPSKVVSPRPKLKRDPTMLRGGPALIAPKESHEKKYTIVLDLDETVVYARDGPLFARANLANLLRVMDEYCEVIVWTAGERNYAKAILQEINTDNIIKHLVYRHRKWFNAADYTKDLGLLGRDLDYVLIVENTPDCVRANPQNGIIVEDFEGAPRSPATPRVKGNTPPPSPTDGKKKSTDSDDHTFIHLMQLVRELGQSGEPVPQFLAKCRLLRRQTVVGSNNEHIPIFYLTSKKRIYRPKVNIEVEGDADAKVVKVNKDKALTTPTTPKNPRLSVPPPESAVSSRKPTKRSREDDSDKGK